ncbi:hypothetical protein NDU88_003082 [Pleurodeles waltl]|uniref:Uncharacterized protein n=1 Tax=Pleurodeles waltl TaxID=8319 RepID=A0AAV7M2F4_PLEWA|nr:hypothetical protein NDU88_003082 [Pleurodeles waltl]
MGFRQRKEQAQREGMAWSHVGASTCAGQMRQWPGMWEAPRGGKVAWHIGDLKWRVVDHSSSSSGESSSARGLKSVDDRCE